MSDNLIHILLVEDDPTDAAQLNQELAESPFGPFVVTHVQRLAEALGKIRERRSDAVLLDLGLPDSQGLATLDRMRPQKSKDIPIVVLTGPEEETLRIAAIRAGADDHLVKGVYTNSVCARTVRYAIERRRAFAASLDTERRLSLALDAAQMGLFEWDFDGDRLTWTHLHRELFGVTPEEFGGNYAAFEQKVHPGDRAEMRTKIRHCIITGEDLWHEYRVIWHDGTEHWLDLRARVSPADQAQPARMIGAVVNISARMDAEKAAKLREADLAHLGRVAAMGQMASGLAHELAQPLGAILNYAGSCINLLDRQPEMAPRIRASIGEVINETRRAGAICSRMRLFVRKQLPNCMALDINQLVSESVKMMDWDLRARSVQVHLQLADQLPMVFGDVVQIQQVLVNLMLNGAEAMADNSPPRAQLTLSTSISDDAKQVKVCVTDLGQGMSTEDFGRLFEPFFSTKPKGLGMGLNICRSIVENMGGQLMVSANQDQGMCFCFTIPVAMDHTA